jgi:nickel-type superoxide dismutase
VAQGQARATVGLHALVIRRYGRRIHEAAHAPARTELVKHHLWVLWTDYFKPPHFEKYPQLNTLFNEATKLAGGGGGTKSSTDPAVADQLLAKIDEINKIFWETKQG